jgi:hypothetical protein
MTISNGIRRKIDADYANLQGELKIKQRLVQVHESADRKKLDKFKLYQTSNIYSKESKEPVFVAME